jgi:MFS family permease
LLQVPAHSRVLGQPERASSGSRGAGGLAVAFGPITGGALLEPYSWGSTFLVKLPLALGRDRPGAAARAGEPRPEAPRIDVPGLLLSALGLGALVHTIIEAPGHGWGSGSTLVGFAAAAALLAAFVRHERRTAQPMLDLRLFADRRFTAAALAITVALAGAVVAAIALPARPPAVSAPDERAAATP